MKLAWMSDIHLSHVRYAEYRSLFDSAKMRSDALVITGDIISSDEILTTLGHISKIYTKPVYFVLGNHDFYYGSIKKTRLDVARLTNTTSNLFYLTGSPIMELTPTTALVGHDGWADGRHGDMATSDVVINDFLLIDEMQHWRDTYTNNPELDKPPLRRALEKQAAIAVDNLNMVLQPAVQKYENIIVATHIPPFRESARYSGEQTDDNWLPYMTCKAVGDLLLQVAVEWPKCKFTILCGHTHSQCEFDAAENLKVITASAEYGKPTIQHIFDI